MNSLEARLPVRALAEALGDLLVRSVTGRGSALNRRQSDALLADKALR
jgi:hypothetical protein